MYQITEFTLFILSILVLMPILGTYMAYVFDDVQKKQVFVLSSLESFTYRLCNINPSDEMHWKLYAKSLIIVNTIGFLVLFAIQSLQQWLPINPQHFASIPWPSAFNTAASFTTNTNWQSYAGEITMSYLTQMQGLTVQNFLSAATGNTVLLALIRGFVRKKCETIGNFWVDLTRSVIYLLLPLSVLFSIILVSQGVIQNFNPYQVVKTLAGDEQIIPMGPVASQVAIKQLGTNGGGFFNANSAHPFENPTPFSNFLETLAILLIPAASVYMYGLLIKSKKQAATIFSVMLILWFAGIFISLISEYAPNPNLNELPYLEGKEVRFGVPQSILWSSTTSATSSGSVNSMLTSLTPIAGGVALFNIMLGEIIFGGVGVGLCGMLMFALLAVFLAGLMVGRTPEYLGKKIEKNEMQWVMLAILAPCALILIGSGIAALLPSALNEASKKGPHGLSEILYAFSSASGNNGSAFSSLDTNTDFYNILLGVIMIIARLVIIIASLGLSGHLASKTPTASSSGTFRTDSPLFSVLLLMVILIVAGLSFFPALSLGPLMEHLLMKNELINNFG